MDKLLVAVDFSPSSVNAARFAADVAAHINVAVVLLHVININMLVNGLPIEAGVYSRTEDDAELQLASLQEELSDRIMGKVPVSFQMVSGFVASELKNYSQQIKPLAIVMGAQGKSKMDRLMLGSNTTEAIKSLRYPVWVIPADAIFTKIRKVALASDMENTRTLPLNTIDYFVQLFSAELQILHVSNSTRTLNSADIEKALHANFYHIKNKDVEAGINQYTKEHHVQLLVLVHRSRNPFSDTFHKSMSAHISWHPIVPVMILPEII